MSVYQKFSDSFILRALVGYRVNPIGEHHLTSALIALPVAVKLIDVDTQYKYKLL